MLEKSQRDLARSVRRKLAARLLAVTIPLAVLAAVAVYWVERDRLGRDVVAWSGMQAALFNADQGQVLDRIGEVTPEGLEAAMLEFSAERGGGQLGRFDAVHILAPSGELFARFERPELADAADHDELLESGRFPDGAGPWSSIVRHAGMPHILVQMPLESTAGDRVGSLRGIFHPVAHVVARARRRATRAALAVLGMMLIIGLALWPMLRQLVDRLGRLSGGLLEANMGTLDALGRALAKRDGDTEEHSLRVTIVSVLLAEKVGLDRAEIQSLIKGAALHDVGKIAIRDEILLKPGKLTDEEYEVMKSHVDHGVDIVSRSAWLRSAEDVVHYHHERFGGGGYRRGLAGAEIPLPARIFTIADVFDALASPRPYKEAVGFERTMGIMQESRGEHFDPELFDTFEAMAASIYRRYYSASSSDLESELDRLVDRYFSGGLDALQVG